MPMPLNISNTKNEVDVSNLHRNGTSSHLLCCRPVSPGRPSSGSGAVGGLTQGFCPHQEGPSLTQSLHQLWCETLLYCAGHTILRSNSQQTKNSSVFTQILLTLKPIIFFNVIYLQIPSVLGQSYSHENNINANTKKVQVKVSHLIISLFWSIPQYSTLKLLHVISSVSCCMKNGSLWIWQHYNKISKYKSIK